MARESDRMAIDKKGTKRKAEADVEDRQENSVAFNAAQSKYIAQVRLTCSRATFKEFLGLVKEHRAKPMRMVDVIPRLENLFQSHKHWLVPGFDVFLPEGGKIIDLASKDQKARRVISNVEEALDPDAKRSFGDLVMQLKDCKITIDEAYKTVRKLFKDDPYLLSQFRTLMPVPAYMRRTPEQADRDPIPKNPISISPNEKQSRLRLKPTAQNLRENTQIMGLNRRSLRSVTDQDPPRTPSLLPSEEDEAPQAVKPMDEEAFKRCKELMDRVDKRRYHGHLCANENYPMDDPTVGDSEEYKAQCAVKLAEGVELLRKLGIYR